MDQTNPVLILWDGSLIFLGIVLHVILFPMLWLITAPITALVHLARRDRRRREAAYSWSVPTKHVNRSGYRRRRYGRFYA